MFLWWILLTTSLDLPDFPCECGHPRSLHFENGIGATCQKRKGFGIRGTGWVDDCLVYRPDNLKYLEDQYESKS